MSHKKYRQRFFEENPFCCFCGGKTLATTIDHIPSKQTFILKRRPQGIEVPACVECNQKTKEMEQVVATFSRVYPDVTTEEEFLELRKLLKHSEKSFPGFLDEIKSTPKQRIKLNMMQSRPADIERGNALNAKGPIVNKCMHAFGFKLGCALHYWETKKIIPKEGGVAVRWYTNFQAFNGDIKGEIFDILGEAKTLKQGEWTAEEEFQYAFAIADTKAIAAYFASFRASFAILCWVQSDATQFPREMEDSVYKILRP